MTRRTRSQPERFQQILTKIQRIVDSPLREIGLRLQDAVNHVLRAIDSTPDALDSSALAADLETMVDILPRSFGDRFLFDSSMILATSEALSTVGLQLNPMIVPLQSTKWGHESLPMPWSDGTKINLVDFIHIPGGDDITTINLLAYPFLLHELGHNLFFRRDASFSAGFRTELSTIVNELRLSSIADRGSARSLALLRIRELEAFWTPNPTHKNWAHELAIDVLALWLCGPAYLAAYHDEMDQLHIDPFLIGQNHPPNEVRLFALVALAKQLGWGQYCDGPKTLLEQWRQSLQKLPTTDRNRYVSLTGRRTIEACIASAVAACRTLRLPQCTADTMASLQQMMIRNETPDFGLELVICAWLVHHQEGPNAYGTWEHSTIKDLMRFTSYGNS
jgi:hypothetical protein